MRYRPSLYLRLIAALLGPMLIGMAAAWTIGAGIVTSALEHRQERQLRNAAMVLASGGLPFTPEVLRRLASLQESDFVLLDAAGAVALSTSQQVADAVVGSLRRGAWTATETRRIKTPAQSLAVYQTIDDPLNPRYAALVAVAPLSDATAAATRATWWLGLAMLAAAVALAAVVLALVRNITRPLAQLSALADRIASGEREQHLDLARADEIGALAESLNAMMEKLGSYESRLASNSRMLALGEMSARVAHEIRNPLTGLKLHLQLLSERVAGAEHERVDRLLREVERLELLVASTLLLGAEQPLKPARTGIRALISEVADLMAPSLGHRKVRTEVQCDDDLEADIDRGRVRQALLNLIVNAADAMPQGGTLRIGVESDSANSRLLMAVEDAGPGFDAGVRERVADAPFSTKPFGLGVGLAICRDVARAHGGELLFERSVALGGARLVIALPFTPVMRSCEPT